MVHNCSEMMDVISRMGMLPLLDGEVAGFSADAMVSPDCRYMVKEDGGWEWRLWKWKGTLITDGRFAYGKFFDSKAGFMTMEWWPDFCNWRRSRHPEPDADSVERAILDTLQCNGNMITRDLRAACGFDGARMRGKFDSYVTRLQMSCRVVIEDFVYPTDRQGRPYGWGWALLTTPEALFGRDACRCSRSPEESRDRLVRHLGTLLPHATSRQLEKLVG